MALIIWRGRGGVIFLIMFGCALLTALITRAVFRDASYYDTHRWPMLVALWVAAGLVYALRRWFGVGQRGQVDEGTGQEIKVPLEGHLFFISARYWPAILLLGGVLFFFFGR